MDGLLSLLYSALRQGHEVFPEQLNIDMIFGRPCQTLNGWIEELSEVIYMYYTFHQE